MDQLLPVQELALVLPLPPSINHQYATVNGRRAIWAVGPYPLRFSNGNLDFVRMVDGHVLIWTEGDPLAPGARAGVTYRLETKSGLEEAIKVAESLKPFR